MNSDWGVGNKSQDKAFGTAIIGAKVVELIFGEHPHSRSDNNIYARFASGRVEGFNGHRIITKVELEEHNYLKTSDMSGDEVRKAGTGKIYFDGIQCYEFFFRDIDSALLTAHSLVSKLKHHESDWSVRDQRAKLKGRKVFYREQPAIIESLIVDQGCVILKPDGLPKFKAPIYDLERECNDITKCEVIDPNIWWWRS